MKVLITGSNGLLGQKLIHKLREDDAVELVATSIGENRVSEKEGYSYISLDITNENELKKALDGTGNSTFNIVKESDEKFEGPKGNAKELNLNIAEDLAAFLATKKYHVDRDLGNQVGPYTSPVHPQNVYDSYQHYLFASEELGNAEREDGSGHNSILSTDITKKGESMFNSPRVIFSKGDVLGETPGEIINNTEFKQTEFILPTETQPTKKKKFKRGSKSKGIIDNLGENCK